MIKIPQLIKTNLHNPDVVRRFGTIEDKKYVAVIDLELTCWSETDPDKQPREKAEIIQIGIVVLDLKDYSTICEISKYCKPIYYPKLSNFCTELTGITQEHVDSVANLSVEFSRIKDEYPIIANQKELLWAAWGNDIKWLQDEINKKVFKTKDKIELDPRLINIKEHSRSFGFPAGLSKCLEKLNINKRLPIHDALVDASNTAEVFKKLKLNNLDAHISNDRTYSEALKSRKMKIQQDLSKKAKISEEKAEKILNYVGWDFQIALNIINLLK